MKAYEIYYNKHYTDVCIKIPKKIIFNRDMIFKQILFDKRVLHIGCTDSPYTSQNIMNNSLLHRKLIQICSHVVGIDTDLNGIEIMKKNGNNNVFLGDIYDLTSNFHLKGIIFDYILVSEVIEHLNNPGIALESIKKYINNTNPQCKIIFTIPNYQNYLIYFFYSILGEEAVHFDHKYYFSYRTFRRLLETSNYIIDCFCFIHRKMTFISLERIILELCPCFASGLLFICSIENNQQYQ